MVKSQETSISAYLDALPVERRKMVSAIRDAVLQRLPQGYVETMQYGMISYIIPLERYPDTYNRLPLAVASLASQKNYVSFYINTVYADPGIQAWFLEEYRKTGKKFDMGKSCLRFKQLDDIPLKLLGETIARTPVNDYIAIYERSRRASK